MEGKRKRCEKVENNSNVSFFLSNPDHDNCDLFSFDPMPPLWVSYTICARVVDIVVDMIISDGLYDLFVQVLKLGLYIVDLAISKGREARTVAETAIISGIKYDHHTLHTLPPDLSLVLHKGG